MRRPARTILALRTLPFAEKSGPSRRCEAPFQEAVERVMHEVDAYAQPAV